MVEVAMVLAHLAAAARVEVGSELVAAAWAVAA